MSKYRDYVLLEYSDIQQGDVRHSEMCPQCSGGSSGERSLSVGRGPDGLWWKCWRSSCGFKGKDGTATAAPVGTVRERRKLEYYTRPLQEDEISTLVHKNIPPYKIAECSYTENYGGRFVLPLNSRERVVGNVLRSYNGGTPKALTDLWYGYEGCAWEGYTYRPDDVVIVEDIVSAARMASYTAAACLLGVNLTDEKVSDLSEAAAGTYWLALDADAFSRCVSTVVRLKQRLNIRVLRLAKDIKDMTEDEFSELVYTIEDNKTK